ncbi:MAG: tRNA lysidine(34) synthetase TilS [Clostridiaceae bacterium]
MIDLLQKVIRTIEDNQMIKKGDKIIVAVSGGPDSICLLHILSTLKEKYSIELYAAHINHCLRGDEADEDEEYVRGFCKQYAIDFHSIKIDVANLAKEKKMSFETTAREARYMFFDEVMKKVEGDKIALAHNANDQCETVLMRIMRGTGIQGLAGIRPVRDNTYIRPLLNITREEIEKYCSTNDLKPRLDKTNLETIYTRNKIRLELIPYIEENFNSNIIDSINRLVENITIDMDFMDFLSKEFYNKYTSVEKDRIILSKKLFFEHKAIVSRVIRSSIESLKGNLFNYEKVHIDDIIKLQCSNTGKTIMLPGNFVAINNYGDIHILSKLDLCLENNESEYKLQLGKNQITKDICVNLEIISIEEINEKFKNDDVKYFDYDKINDDVILRYRRDGDRIIPLGMKGSKKLKDLFIDLKIPKEKRDSIPLICFGEEIAWIVGYRTSEKFKIEKSTKNILKIFIEREAEE